MLNEGTTDYPTVFTEKPMPNDSSSPHHQKDQMVQKWIGMVDRCLEQQWKDSQHLLGRAKALKEGLFDPDVVVKELSDLGLGMMQRSIDLRQELVNNAYSIDDDEEEEVDEHSVSHSSFDPPHSPLHECSNPDDTLNSGGSCYIFLPSSPESDIYQPLLTKIHNKTGSTYQDEHKRLSDSSDNGTCYSPFTLHSKLWQQHLQQKQSGSMLSSSSSSSSLASASPTTLYTLSSSRHNNGKIGLGSLLAPSNPITSLQDDNALIQGDTLVQQQDDEKSMDYNKSSSQCLSECNYSSSLSITEDLEIQCKQCFLWPRTQSLDPLKSDNSSTAKVGQDDKKDMPPPDILSSIPIRTSSSLDTAPFVIPQATTSAPLLSDNTSMAQTISTRFHFKRTPKKKSMIPVSSSSSIPTTAFSHHRTASATDDLGNTGKSNKFVRSLITRKVSFPAIFSSKKIHPTTSISSSPVQSNGVFI